jgi:hypothetical protein
VKHTCDLSTKEADPRGFRGFHQCFETDFQETKKETKETKTKKKVVFILTELLEVKWSKIMSYQSFNASEMEF